MSTVPSARVIAIGPALAVLMLLLAAATSPPDAQAAECRGADAAPAKLKQREAAKAVLCLINRERRGHGLSPLHRQGEQAEAAGKHTKVMIRDRCFSHQCPGESDLTGRLVRADYMPCNCSWGIAENLADGDRRLGSPRRIVDAWMNSSDHRANILNRSYQHIGVGVAWGTPSSGRDRGSATYTTDFGYRR